MVQGDTVVGSVGRDDRAGRCAAVVTHEPFEAHAPLVEPSRGQLAQRVASDGAAKRSGPSERRERERTVGAVSAQGQNHRICEERAAFPRELVVARDGEMVGTAEEDVDGRRAENEEHLAAAVYARERPVLVRSARDERSTT